MIHHPRDKKGMRYVHSAPALNKLGLGGQLIGVPIMVRRTTPGMAVIPTVDRISKGQGWGRTRGRRGARRCIKRCGWGLFLFLIRDRYDPLTCM